MASGTNNPWDMLRRTGRPRIEVDEGIFNDQTSGVQLALASTYPPASRKQVQLLSLFS